MKTHLNEWMDHFELSVEKLGEMSGISPKIITKWLNETTTPSLAAITHISETLGITIDDIVNNTPKQAIDNISNSHLIETTDIKTAVRVQNYFTEKEIDHQVVVRDVDGVEVFLINYVSTLPLDIKEISKISKLWRYKDAREKSTEVDIRYERMMISNM